MATQAGTCAGSPAWPWPEPMVAVTFVAHDGRSHRVEANVGQTLMQAAVFNNVPGIVADCGGNTSCGTCHVFIGEPWAAQLPPKSTPERIMLGSIAREAPTSRLSCCIMVTEALGGLVAALPESQY